MSNLCDSALIEKNFPHQPALKPTQSPLNDFLELALPECSLSNDTNKEGEQNNGQDNDLKSKKILQFLSEKL